jgi:hypothetical protein
MAFSIASRFGHSDGDGFSMDIESDVEKFFHLCVCGFRSITG